MAANYRSVVLWEWRSFCVTDHCALAPNDRIRHRRQSNSSSAAVCGQSPRRTRTLQGGIFRRWLHITWRVVLRNRFKTKEFTSLSGNIQLPTYRYTATEYVFGFYLVPSFAIKILYHCAICRIHSMCPVDCNVLTTKNGHHGKKTYQHIRKFLVINLLLLYAWFNSLGWVWNISSSRSLRDISHPQTCYVFEFVFIYIFKDKLENIACYCFY